VLRKAIYILFSATMAGLVAFVVTSLRRDVSLRTDFWFLIVIAVMMTMTRILMAIESDRRERMIAKIMARANG
jgi:hypothetical protein